ncbi:MAG: SprT family zinc-dependent metalloprotease [Gammaproteobacteria bacterium]
MKRNDREYLIEIEGLSIQVVKKTVKNLYFSVNPPDGWVRVTAPKRIHPKAIELAIISKLEWIKKQQKKFSTQALITPTELIPGELHYFLGRKYMLDIEYALGSSRVELRSNQTICLLIKYNTSYQTKTELLEQWYRKQLYQTVAQLIQKWEGITGLKVAQYGIKRMKTRWGSCNISAKRIWLNLELIKKPLHCIEYVVVHEIVHFLERTHGPRFISYMDHFLPQWRDYKQELNSFS